MLEELKYHIDKRFDRVENKLDSHLERISKAEEAIIWLKGHVKISTTLVLTIIGAALAAYFQYGG